ncbi:hypothetical protein [Pseudobacter ginsenosidimutans]|uniref:Lipoprotein n=1 Tax=Pseudobacter ginsenosidimutans TaxID=661488 RepID=A0A4Q7N5F1_9BACT|nr:hypothetical protein [Pseudobacter ginsenosidimutans]QEC44788.1 hypothetical protein FSB84_25045 [Pseudobacter ginsenosidimutans]RZS76275.1 hypothetical protein EV199_2155 [Pseudobacter ginsenosidimutans]
MKIKMKNNCVGALLLLILAAACKETTPARKKHELEIFWPGSFFYLDQVKNKQVMQIKDAEEDKLYASYLVGFHDSAWAPDPQQPKKAEERQVYYQFNMSNNWRAIVNGDSLLPVFYQPVPNADNKVNAGVIVFQLPEGTRPDTLVYRNAGDGWENMIISLKQHKLIQ